MLRDLNYDEALQRRLAVFVNEGASRRAVLDADDFCVGTNIGLVRKQNQDRAALAFASYGRERGRNLFLAAVCDGMGGLAQGDVAATIALSVFISRVVKDGRQPLRERLVEAANAANFSVNREFNGKGGSTLSAVALEQGSSQIVAINVGDSRVYGINQQRKPVQLSKDDTLAGYLGNSPDAERRNQLVQYIGMGEGIEPHILDAPRLEFPVMLLTTDGAHSLPLDVFTQSVVSADQPAAIVRRLLNLSDGTGGRDNATAIALHTDTSRLPFVTEPGVFLTFMSVKGSSLEVWLPADLNDVRNANAPNIAQKNIPVHERPNNESGGRPRRKKSKAKNAPMKSDDQALPLEDERPEVEVEFLKKA